ncbi:thiamine biosynthesis lipoprotein [Inhella inkyongensis]|uniref:FAD:protein FMN transferase n=1 Tax=Inhella inkyongensis TaxID=392593 RepID=A0A840S1U3_9BURK|nr:FAD:protein FMN transferase [Inhella inkyongensis]MBB5203388.1 thiamine biosynthesis lipoprotein [Inhella inkyongensis]
MGLPRLNRRRFAQGALLAPCMELALAGPDVQRQSRVLMGTRVQIVAPGRAADLAPALAAAWAEMARLEALLSRYRDDNPVAALAARAGRQPLRVAPELVAVLQQARTVSARSAGAFDVTVGAYRDWHFESGEPVSQPPSAERLRAQARQVDWRAIEIDGEQVLLNRPGMRLDLGGIAKLPILAAGLQTLRQHGLRDALIDGGGDIGAMGQIDGRPWRVGLRDPLAPQRLLGTVAVRDGWVASSGDYERSFVHQGRLYHHVLDPRSGEPAQGLHGISLMASDWRSINGLGTALMVRGLGAIERWTGPSIQAVAVAPGARRWQSLSLRLASA